MGRSASSLWRKVRRRLGVDGSEEFFAEQRGYVMVFRPTHPLAAKWGWVREHRAILYDAVGPGPHACWFCGREVTWDKALVVDHLDHDRSNNDISNLAACCRPCNSSRKKQRSGPAPSESIPVEGAVLDLVDMLEELGDPWLLPEPQFELWWDQEYERHVEDPRA